MAFETRELRVVAVALGLAAQNFLRQQRLATRPPPFGIEMLWMQRPDAHGYLSQPLRQKNQNGIATVSAINNSANG